MSLISQLSVCFILYIQQSSETTTVAKQLYKIDRFTFFSSRFFKMTLQYFFYLLFKAIWLPLISYIHPFESVSQSVRIISFPIEGLSFSPGNPASFINKPWPPQNSPLPLKTQITNQIKSIKNMSFYQNASSNSNCTSVQPLYQ